MSIELVVGIVLVIVAAGLIALSKVRTGSFVPWWWHREINRDE